MSLSGIHEKIMLKQQRDYKSDTKDAPKKKKTKFQIQLIKLKCVVCWQNL